MVIVICKLFSIKTDPEFLLKNSQMHDSVVNLAIALSSSFSSKGEFLFDIIELFNNTNHLNTTATKI